MIEGDQRYSGRHPLLFPVNRHVQGIVEARGLPVRRENFDNFPLLVRGGIAVVNHLVSTHHDLDHVSAPRTTNHDPPAESKIFDPPVIESEVINAVWAIEQRDTLGFHWESSGEERTGETIMTGSRELFGRDFFNSAWPNH